MKICRFLSPDQGARLGAIVEGAVLDLSAADSTHFGSLTAFLEWSAGRADSLAAALQPFVVRAPWVASWDELRCGQSAGGLRLLRPTDDQEIWGAGVTYHRSREAREQESGASRLYDRVYQAERPELFFKATPHRTVGPGEAICVRGDSRWTVPEPELAVVLNPSLEVVGFTLANDVTARDVEGENALYLPQAKIFVGCCAVGPAITLVNGPASTESVTIRCRVVRKGSIVFSEQVSVSRMKRSLAELIAYLGRDNAFPQGVVLMTGTGIVPPDNLALADGDMVEIVADGLGTLVNPVRQLQRAPG